MDPAEDTPAWFSSKSSAKRCLSPSEDIKLGNTNKKQKRKVANPLLILVQDEVFGKREDGRVACLDDLEEQYEEILANTNKQGGLISTRSDPPTNDQGQTDLIQSTDSLSLESLNNQLLKIFAKQ